MGKAAGLEGSGVGRDPGPWSVSVLHIRDPQGQPSRASRSVGRSRNVHSWSSRFVLAKHGVAGRGLTGWTLKDPWELAGHRGHH